MLLSFYALAQTCAPGVHPATLERVVQVESSFNPYAIGVVKGKLARQPKTLEEAKATVAMLEKAGYNYSVGLAQINKTNFKRYGLTASSAFDPCENLRAGAEILSDCFRSAKGVNAQPQAALRDALSCYYSGDLKRGHRLGYVAKIEGAFKGRGKAPLLRQAGNSLTVEQMVQKPDMPPNPPDMGSSLLF